MDGALRIFKGPLKDNTGKDVIRPASRITVRPI